MLTPGRDEAVAIEVIEENRVATEAAARELFESVRKKSEERFRLQKELRTMTREDDDRHKPRLPSSLALRQRAERMGLYGRAAIYQPWSGGGGDGARAGSSGHRAPPPMSYSSTEPPSPSSSEGGDEH